MRRLILPALLLSCFAGTASATCYADAAARYRLPEDLLKAVVKVESGGRPEAMNLGHQTRTGSYDIGLMQINSSWLKKLKNFNITEQMLKEPCQNVLVGAWILSHHLRETGADWNGVGSYNASCRTLSKEACEKTRFGYSWKVYRALMKLRNQPLNEAPAATKAAPPTAAPVLQVRAQRSIRTVALGEGETVASELAENTRSNQAAKVSEVHEPRSFHVAQAPIAEMESDDMPMDDDKATD